MSDLQRYIQQRKLKDSVFAKDFDSGYESFKAEILHAMNPDQHSNRIMNNLYPYEPDYAVSPGKVLSEYLESYEMTQTELAQQLELSQETMNAIIEAQIAIAPEIATKLQKVFQRPAHFWINLQDHYEQTLIRLGQRESNNELKVSYHLNNSLSEP